MRSAPILLLSIFLLASQLLPGMAAASTLYRCKGSSGEDVYTSERHGYTECRRLGNFPNPPPAPAPKAEATGATSGSAPRKADLRTAPPGKTLSAPPAPAGATVTRGAVYRYEKDGITHYTNRAPGKDAKATLLFSYIETCYACAALPGLDWNQVGLNLTAYSAEVGASARLAGIEPALVRAIMHAESAFNPNAVSHVGAQGLMQLMPATAERFGVTDAFTPADNIGGGSQYLAWLMKRYDNDITRVAAAYNAGEGAVDRHGGVPPYEETQRFVERVGILYNRYRDALSKPVAATGAATGSP